MTVEAIDYLEHFGVKGMRWGVRKDARNDVKKLNKLDQDRAKLKDVIDARSAADKTYEKAAVKQVIKNTKAQKMSAVAGSPANTPGDPVAVAIVAVTAYGLTRAAVRQYTDSGRRDAKQTGDREFKKNPALAKPAPPMTVDSILKDVVKPVNPGFGEKGTTMNCRRATMAYEMRRRGHDVKATKTVAATGQAASGMKKAVGLDPKKSESVWGEKKIDFPRDAMLGDKKVADTVFNELSKQPNGSRGEVGVGWLFGGGHSMAYEVVNRKPVIFDAQSGQAYKNPREFDEFTQVLTAAAFTRLDNKPIDDKFVKRWVKDV